MEQMIPTVGQAFHQVHFVFCAQGFEIDLCQCRRRNAFDPGVIHHLKSARRDLICTAKLAKGDAVADDAAFLPISPAPAAIVGRPGGDINPNPPRGAGEQTIHAIVEDLDAARQTERRDGSQMRLPVRREIASGDPEACSRDRSRVDASRFTGAGKGLVQHIFQPVIAHALMISSARSAKPDTLAGFIDDQRMGLGGTHINTQEIFHPFLIAVRIWRYPIDLISSCWRKVFNASLMKTL